ncbi:MAG: branched-chain amino acid ABC transporter permease [Pseudomonadota bacterium]
MSAKIGRRTRRVLPAVVVLGLFAVLPVLLWWGNQTFYLGIVSRIMILGLAAVGLNLILGYGGLVSFGHAMYLGIGAYAVGILSANGYDSAGAHVLWALGIGLFVSALVGWICLKTEGMAFIMITLAFGQMFYFLSISLKQYGGDDGLPVVSRSKLPLVDTANPYSFYYLSFAILLLVLFICYRLVNSRFGFVLQGCKQNERRMKALGFDTYKFKLLAYVLSAEIAVIAGVLLANLAKFASPSYLNWTLSGDLILMCVLGGASSLIGPLIGAAAFVALEDFLSTMPVRLPGEWNDLVTTHWLGIFGVFVVLVVIFVRRGLYGVLQERANRA